jgi:outer membrane protein assembly factor BamD (BamD/ComL family)
MFTSSLYAKDYHKTVEMIKDILKEESDSGKNKSQPADIKEDEKKSVEKTKENNKNKDDDSKNKKNEMSGNDEILLKTGIQFYESGMFDHSLVKFNDLIKNHATSKFINQARMWAGRIYLKKYQYDEAIKLFDEIKEKSGEYPASLYYKAESLKYKGDTINAIEYYHKLSTSYPENVLADKAILNTGKIYMHNEKGYKALEEAIKIIRYYKSRDTIDDAYYLIAKIYEKDPLLKDLEISRKFYQIIIRKSEQNQKFFTDSPLLPAVRNDLSHLEKTYFKFEK